MKLVDAVYARRGNSLEIRAAIEADCIAERQRAADQAAAMAALRPGTAPDASVPNRAQIGTANPTLEGQSGPSADNKLASKKIRCDGLRREQEEVLLRARAGSSTAQMENLSKQRRTIERQTSEAGC